MNEQKLIIQDLKIQNLRSYKDNTNKITFSEHTNVIVGLNGTGKSSILEGLAYVLTGKVPEGTTAQMWVNQTQRPPFRAGAELCIKDVSTDRTHRVGKFMQATPKADNGIILRATRDSEELGIHIKPAILKYCLVCHEKQSQWMFETDAAVTKIFNEIFNTEAYMNYSEVLGKISSEIEKASAGVTTGRGRKAVATVQTQALINQKQFIQAQKTMLESKNCYQCVKNVNFTNVIKEINQFETAKRSLQSVNFDDLQPKEVIESYLEVNNVTNEAQQQQSNEGVDLELLQISTALNNLKQERVKANEEIQLIQQQFNQSKLLLSQITPQLQTYGISNIGSQYQFPDGQALNNILSELQNKSQYAHEALSQDMNIKILLQGENQTQIKLDQEIQNATITILNTIVYNTINLAKIQRCNDIKQQLLNNDVQISNITKMLQNKKYTLDTLQRKKHELEQSNERIINLQNTLDSLNSQIQQDILHIKQTEQQVNDKVQEISIINEQIDTLKKSINTQQQNQSILQKSIEQLNQFDKNEYSQLLKLINCFIDNGICNGNNIIDVEQKMQQFQQSYNSITFQVHDEKLQTLIKLLQNPEAYKQMLIDKKADMEQQMLMKQYVQYLPNISQAYTNYLNQQLELNNNQFLKDNKEQLLSIFNSFVEQQQQRGEEAIPQEQDNETQIYDFYTQYQYIFSYFKEEGADVIQIMNASRQLFHTIKQVFNQLQSQQIFNFYEQKLQFQTFIERNNEFLILIEEQIKSNLNKLEQDITQLIQQQQEKQSEHQNSLNQLHMKQKQYQECNTTYQMLKQELQLLYNSDNLENKIQSIQQEIGTLNGQLSAYEQNKNQLKGQLETDQNDIIQQQIIDNVNDLIKQFNIWKLQKYAKFYNNKCVHLNKTANLQIEKLKKMENDEIILKQFSQCHQFKIIYESAKRQILQFIHNNQEYVNYFSKFSDTKYLKNLNLQTLDQHIDDLRNLFYNHSSQQYQSILSTKYKQDQQNFDELKQQFVRQKVNDLCKSELNLAKQMIQSAVKQFQSRSIVSVNLMLKDMWQNVYRPGNNEGSVENVYLSFSDNEKSSIVVKVRVKGKSSYEERTARNGLSSGQQVLFSILLRAALAKAFARNFALLCLDEPTNYLDKQHVEDLAIYLKRFADENRTQLIVVTHSEEFADALDRDGSVRRIVVEHGAAGSVHMERLV